MLPRRDVLAGVAALSSVGLSGSALAADAPELSCGLSVAEMLDAEPPALRVTEIAWDSGFRGTALAVGDQILAVNGAAIANPKTPEDRARFLQHTIGSLGEPAGWAGLAEEAQVTLSVRRRVTPGQGWRTFPVTGALRAASAWRDAGDEPLMGPGGPPEMFQNDGFATGWREWYDGDVRPAVRRNLDDGLFALAQSTRVELPAHLDRMARAAVLATRYPGPFATAVAADCEAVLARLQGESIALSESDLDWRRAEDQRVQQVRDTARVAWTAALAAHETIEPFPAIDPSRQDRHPLLGHRTVLGPLRNADWITDTGRSWFAAGSPDQGFYFLDAEAPEMQAALVAVERYRRVVAPDIDESYRFLVEIVDAARLGAVEGAAYFGLRPRLIAAMVGESVFVDVAAGGRFAGEEAFAAPRATLPAAEAPPAAVMRAFVDAIKQGDIATWRALFADWWIDRLPDGRPLLYPHAVRVEDDRFEQARRLMLGRVWEARPVWTGDPRIVVDGGAYAGALHIEEVDVELRHYGRFDDGYRSFADVTVNAFWKLQRVDGSAWRIAEQHVL